MEFVEFPEAFLLALENRYHFGGDESSRKAPFWKKIRRSLWGTGKCFSFGDLEPFFFLRFSAAQAPLKTMIFE
jgi:hypothetical protein